MSSFVLSLNPSSEREVCNILGILKIVDLQLDNPAGQGMSRGLRTIQSRPAFSLQPPSKGIHSLMIAFCGYSPTVAADLRRVSL